MKKQIFTETFGNNHSYIQPWRKGNILFLGKYVHMKLVPLFKCRDMKKAVTFYTTILDFEIKDKIAGETVVNLIHDTIELQLTTHESDSLFGSVVNIWVTQIDELFAKYQSRGLQTANKKNSPVHQGPLDQTWGTREFYVTDEDGNTLRFCQSKTNGQ